jgi:Poly(R)-hydroxyalkanoic acid synthase subunit (PHA_synth_III_E)
MSGPGDTFPWLAAWHGAQGEFERFAAQGAPPAPSFTAQAQRRLADYAAEYAGVASAFWNQFQSPHLNFDALREPLIERYRQLFMASAVATSGAGHGEAGAAWIRYQQATERYAQQATAIALDASERLRAALADNEPGAKPITSLRELHALWVECGEAAYSRAAHREEFAAAQAELLSALVELRAGAQTR